MAVQCNQLEGSRVAYEACEEAAGVVELVPLTHGGLPEPWWMGPVLVIIVIVIVSMLIAVAMEEE